MSLRLRVTEVDDSVPGIRSVVLAPTEPAAELPTFVPGSHLVLDCGERANAYSLTGEAVRPSTYSISVLRVEDGHGGSRWVHESLVPGQVVKAQLPRSAFPPVARASKHLLIAGGIGVTPILSHLRAAVAWGRDVHVLYTFRPGAGAHIGELRTLADDRLELFDDQPAFVNRLADVLSNQPLGTHLYVCGPGAMMDHVLGTASMLGWPASRLHSERFGADALDPGEPFTVDLVQSGATVEVPSGVSLLEALEAAGKKIPNLCRQGVCGECRIPVTDGQPLHRDFFLSGEEKQAGDCVMPCVSRAQGANLKVPL